MQHAQKEQIDVLNQRLKCTKLFIYLLVNIIIFFKYIFYFYSGSSDIVVLFLAIPDSDVVSVNARYYLTGCRCVFTLITLM